MGNQLSEKVKFTKDEVFAISDNTLLLGVDINCVTEAIDLLKMYLGETRYFDIIFVNGYVVVMLLSKDNEEVREKLNAIIAKSIELHEKAKRKPLKKKAAKTEGAVEVEKEASPQE